MSKPKDAGNVARCETRGEVWRAVVTTITRTFGILILLAGALWLVGGVFYLANDWRYGQLIAWIATVWSLGLFGLGTLLVSPFQTSTCILSAAFSALSALLYFMLIFVAETQEISLLFGCIPLLAAAAAAALAVFNHRRDDTLEHG